MNIINLEMDQMFTQFKILNNLAQNIQSNRKYKILTIKHRGSCLSNLSPTILLTSCLPPH